MITVRLFCIDATVRGLQSRWRRDVGETDSRLQSGSDAQLHYVDDNIASTHATVGPPTATTSASPATHLPDVHDRPLAVEPIGGGLSSDMRRNPLKDVGAYMTITRTRTKSTVITLTSIITQMHNCLGLTTFSRFASVSRMSPKGLQGNNTVKALMAMLLVFNIHNNSSRNGSMND